MKISSIKDEWVAKQNDGYNAVVLQNDEGNWRCVNFGDDIPEGFYKDPIWFTEKVNPRGFAANNCLRNKLANKEWENLQSRGLRYGVADNDASHPLTRVLREGEKIPLGYEYIEGFTTFSQANEHLQRRMNRVLGGIYTDDPFVD